MTDQDFLSELQYTLLEPPDGGQSWPSGVWSRDLMLAFVNDACQRVVHDAQPITTFLEQFIVAGSLSVSMPTDWLLTAALVWRTHPQGVRTPLIPTDAFESDGGLPGWEVNTGTPIGYCDLDTNTLELRLVPTPDLSGWLENLYVPLPAVVTGNGNDMPVPDELLSACKYDAIRSALQAVTRLEDAARRDYCEERTQILVEATKMLLEGGA